jgi:hypothetical protein
VLLLVVTTLVLSAALPLREFLDQRSAIAELEASADATRERVAELEEERRRLDDPAHIAAEARRRLHMARPGEVGYVLLGPSRCCRRGRGRRRRTGRPLVGAGVGEASRPPTARPRPRTPPAQP